MAIIVNKSNSPEADGSGVGFLFGIIIILVLGFLIFVFGMPFLRKVMTSSPEVNVPGKVDVNIKQNR